MSKTKNISTFAELEKRKKELDLEVEISKRELAHSLNHNRDELRDLVVNKIALPVGGAILGLYVFKKIAFGGKKKRKQALRQQRRMMEQRRDHLEKAEREELEAYRQADRVRQTNTRTVMPPPRPQAGRPAPTPTPPPAPRPQPRPAPQSATAATATTPPPVIVKKENEGMTKKQENKMFDVAKLMAIAKVAIPAAKMIYNAVQKHKNAAGTQPVAQESTQEPVLLPETV